MVSVSVEPLYEAATAVPACTLTKVLFSAAPSASATMRMAFSAPGRSTTAIERDVGSPPAVRASCGRFAMPASDSAPW